VPDRSPCAKTTIGDHRQAQTCVALAQEGSAFCAVHRREVQRPADLAWLRWAIATPRFTDCRVVADRQSRPWERERPWWERG
jgi:hypothetical protein